MADARTLWFEQHSRELALACAPDGTVRWIDGRGARLLRLSPGETLLTRAVAGTEEKLRALLAQARAGEVSGAEVALVVDGRAATVLVRAAPHEEELLLLGSLVPDDFAAVVNQVNEAMAEIVQLNREVAQQRRGLEERNHELTRLNRELSDSQEGVLALLRELEERADAMRRSAEARSRVVSHVSHEFRTPVAAIRSLSRMLLAGIDGVLNTEQTRQVGYIEQSAISLSQLVDDILDLARLESGRGALRSERFALDEFISSLRGILRPLLRPGAAVELLFDPVPEGEPLETDRGKLGQIVRNLVSNALKFTDVGEVRVRCTLSAEQVTIAVSDTGVGIAPEDQALIFEEFTQVAAAQASRPKGTGLGLPLSRALAHALGGTLTVRSQKGAGSTFVLTLPRVHPDVTAVAQLAAAPRDPKKRAVLVLEDDREALLGYARALGPGGYQVIPAQTPDEARAALRRMRPDVVLVDVLLEGETSWEFLRELKGSEAWRELPVFVATISDQEELATSLGASGFFLKPVEPAALLSRLNALKLPIPR